MTSFRHGLVIGKFYPPHAGHHELIRHAARECGRVSVVVMASRVETLALTDRVNWLRVEHAEDGNVGVAGIRCDAPLDVHDPTVWAAHQAVIEAAVRTRSDARVDAVFSAEAYGDELAARLGAKHRRIDRVAAGLSASQVRRDLVGHWDELAPATRAGLALRVVLVGAESTGTTTLARALADTYQARGGVWERTAWVREYGREYTEVKWRQDCAAAQVAGGPIPRLDEIVWTTEDFDAVAREQTRREDEAAATGSPLLVCDTDAFATAIWERRYLADGARSGQAWSTTPSLPRRDIYLVTDHADVPWTDDGLREGDLDIRAAMTGWFVDALTAAGHSWVLVTGTPEQRLSLATRTIDIALRHRLTFGEPLHGPGFESTVPGTERASR